MALLHVGLDLVNNQACALNIQAYVCLRQYTYLSTVNIQGGKGKYSHILKLILSQTCYNIGVSVSLLW
jgi:hypothetical protein